MSRRFYFALAILFLSCVSAAQKVRLGADYSEIKVENGLVFGWNLHSDNASAVQVQVYDKDGKLLASLAPLRFVSDAQSVNVFDVGGLPGKLIAVAAVYRRSDATSPAASLLFFDFGGQLLRALALDPSREAMRLTVDAQSNVWTLTTGTGSQNPSNAPMVVGYRPSGEMFREQFKRSNFPTHASVTQLGPEVGVPGFGHTSSHIWFWLPGSTDFVTFKTDGSSVTRVTTGLPHQSAHEAPNKILLTDEGALVAEIFGRDDQQRQGHFDVFFRSPKSAAWVPSYPPCTKCRLIGLERGMAFFAKWDGAGIELDSSPMP